MKFEDAFRILRKSCFGQARERVDNPKAKILPTRIIADDRGHLVEAQDCKPGQNPFGHFHGTWDEPCHNPGNHCENAINRSSVGVAILKKSKDIYENKIKELESKHDSDSENRKRQMAGVQ